MTHSMRWNRGDGTNAARAMRAAVQHHVDARITSALHDPSKAEIKAMFAQAAANTAKLVVPEAEPSP